MMKLNRHITETATLCLLCLSTFFVNNGVIDADIMESRNIVTAREMVYDGHWLVPTMNGELRIEKPPLPTWLAAMAESIMPDSITAQRTMAGAAAVMLIFFVFNLARHVLRTDPWLPTLMLCTCYNMILMGRTASWDIYCHAFMTGAIYFLACALLEEKGHWWHFILCGVFTGLSVMSKGPVSMYALLLPFIISFSLVCRPTVKGKGWMIASASATAIVVGTWWYAYIYLAHPEAMTYMAGKESGSWLSHNVRPWYYYWKFFLESGVWSLLLLSVIAAPVFSKKLRRLKMYMLSLTWTLLTVVLLSILPEKKTRYLLPMLIPASMTMAFLISYWADRFKSQTASQIDIYVFRVNVWLMALVVLFMPIVTYLFIYKAHFMSSGSLAAFTLFFICVAATLLFAAKKLYPKLTVLTVAVMFAVAECFALPYLSVVINNVSRHSIEMTRHDRQLQALPFYHDSREPLRIEIVYAAHKKIRPLELSCADSIMRHLPCAVITHGNISEAIQEEMLEQIDTVRIDTYDDNRRPKGTRRYSGDFIYNLTIIKEKQN